MNQAGIDKIDELMARKYTALQYQQSLIFIKNMGLLLHCSQEIDQSTLLYFSVSGLPVGEKDYVVLLFSENSKPDPGQNSGQNLYQRSYLYELVEEAAREEFTGHYVFYPCQMDGRLVVLLHFVTGLLPTLAESLMDMVAESCVHVIDHCRETYDLHLSVHASGVTTMRGLASAYHRLLEEVTFYRFTDTDMTGQVTGLVSGDDPHAAVAFEALQRAPLLFSEHIARGDAAPEAVTHLFSLLRWHPSRSVRAIQRELAAMLTETRLRLLHDGCTTEEEFPAALCHTLTEGVPAYEQLEENIHALFSRLASENARRIQAAQAARTAQIRAQVEQRLQDPSLSVASLAADNGMSASALTGAFRRTYGMTLLAYIQQRRLEKAKTLLRETDLPLREICVQCGFGSLETMHRLFRRTLQMTPTQYRRS